jgi:hypothetical protein
MVFGTRETAVIEHNAELGSAKVTFTLTGACRLGCIAYLIDHMLQMRAHLLRNLVHGDVSDGLHGSNGINCGNFNMTVFLLLQNKRCRVTLFRSCLPLGVLDRTIPDCILRG